MKQTILGDCYQGLVVLYSYLIIVVQSVPKYHWINPSSYFGYQFQLVLDHFEKVTYTVVKLIVQHKHKLAYCVCPSHIKTKTPK